MNVVCIHGKPLNSDERCLQCDEACKRHSLDHS